MLKEANLAQSALCAGGQKGVVIEAGLCMWQILIFVDRSPQRVPRPAPLAQVSHILAESGDVARRMDRADLYVVATARRTCPP